MKIGVILNGNYIKNYEINELKNLLKTNNEFSFFIYKNPDQQPRNFSLRRLLFFHKFYSLILIENKFAKLFRKKYFFKSKIDLLNKKISINKVVQNLWKFKKYNFNIQKFQNKYIFDIQTQEIIKKNCDVCILLGFNKIIHPNMLNISKKGILSFHTADTDFYRGRPSGFYEFINNERYGGVTLQRLKKELDKGEIIYKKKIDISKCRSVDETLYKMMKLKKNMLVKGITKISLNYRFRTPKKSKLYIESESKKLNVVFKCLKKTIYRRYII